MEVVMSEWREYRLVDFADINPTERLPKGTIAKKIAMEAIQPFTKRIPSFTLEDYKGGVKFKNGDTIMARITPSLENGKTSYVDILDDGEIGFGSTEFIVFREKQDVSDKHFVYYLATSPIVRNTAIKSMTGSSGRQRVQTDVVKEHLFDAPELPEQKAIASVLSSLDDKIDLLHRQNKTLEQMAETLFRQWFVEEAKEDWEIDTLSFFANFFNGKARPNEEGTIPIYGGNGILGYTNKSNYTGKSIIIGRVGAFCGSLYYENTDIWVSDNALLVKCKKVNSTHFLFYLLKTLELNSMAEGSSHPLLTQTLLKSIEVQIPPLEKINEFDTIVEDIQSKIDWNQTQIRTLEKIRDTLLPKLMSGEIKVKM
jgi:type I restriction enzyme S subunit